VRRAKPGSSGSIFVKSNGLPHLEQGGRRLSTNLKAGWRSWRWSAIGPSYPTVALPKLQIVTINELLGGLDGGAVVRAANVD
jgi:hypothetical protein